MIGTRLWIGIPEPRISSETKKHLQKIKPGGVILFSRNIISRQRLCSLVKELRDLLGDQLRICIDHEGGRVVRITDGMTLFPGNLALGTAALVDEARAMELALLQGQISGQQLREIGIDVNLAPCVDVVTSSRQRGIGSRSFGSDPQLALKLATQLGRGHRQRGVHDCWKHYPGIGKVTVDPHFGLPRIDGALDDYQLVPFTGAAAAGASMMMTSHVVVDGLDPRKPITTSPVALQKHLREQLQFDAVAVTDCLEMGGVAGFDFSEVILGAATAGHDVLLVCHTPALQMQAFELLERAISEDADLHSSHMKSLQRLDRLSHLCATADEDVADGEEIALEIARRGTNLLAGPAVTIDGGEEPGRPEWLLVIPEVEFASPVEDAHGEQLQTLVRGLGERIKPWRTRAQPTTEECHEVVEAARGCGGVLVAVKGLRHREAVQSMLSAIAEQVPRLVVILLEDPRDLVALESGENISVITAHGHQPVHQQALVDVLLGRCTPSAISPLLLD